MVGDTKAASYTLLKHIQTNKAFFNRDTHIQYTEMFALLKLFFFFLFLNSSRFYKTTRFLLHHLLLLLLPRKDEERRRRTLWRL